MTRIQRFAAYLSVTGFDYSPLAWHLSGLPLVDEQHQEVIGALGGGVSG